MIRKNRGRILISLVLTVTYVWALSQSKAEALAKRHLEKTNEEQTKP